MDYRKCFIATILFSLLAISCNGHGSSPTTFDSSSNGGGSSEETVVNKDITYDDIYHFELTKVAPKKGSVLYRASDGYVDNQVQGYNNFYYLARTDDEYNLLLYEGDCFKLNGVVIDNERMTSTSSAFATRSFISPVTASACISGSAFLKEGEQALLLVYKNEQLITQKMVTREGVYHENIVSLNKDDNVYFVLEGAATITYNPVIDFVMDDEVTLHHSADGYYGDVHPYYDLESKKMYMFYLSTGNQSGRKHQTFESLLTTSTDFIRYQDENIQMDNRARPTQDLYYVLNVFKDKEGLYRSSMGMGNHTTTSKSSDLLTWKNGTDPFIDSETDMLIYRYASYYSSDVYSGRDPDMCYISEDDTYYSVVLNYMSVAGAHGDKYLTLYTGNGEGIFSTDGVKLINFKNRGDPECPQIKKIGNRWYLLYSVYGTGTKGNVGKITYRIGDANTKPQDVNWSNKEEFCLDGEDLHAAQINEVGNKYYLFGWLNCRYNTSVWGGRLNLPHEVYQESDGRLRSRLDARLLSLLNKGLIYRDDESYLINQDINVQLTRNLLTADIDLSNNNQAGLQIVHGSDTYFIGIVSKNNKKYLTIHNSFDDYRCEVEAKDVSKYHLTISLDGDYLDINVNNDTTLSAMTNLTDSNKLLSVISNGNKISNLRISKLADYNNIYY
ncbi:MAG TPA: hypothetical protein GX010_01545 [Erysipelotrichaceae bacterium]|nr:hypothetical protein [Erysipelotrichaceae bacterium]